MLEYSWNLKISSCDLRTGMTDVGVEEILRVMHKRQIPPTPLSEGGSF